MKFEKKINIYVIIFAWNQHFINAYVIFVKFKCVDDDDDDDGSTLCV